MKRIIYLALLFIISFMALNVYADSCTDQERETLIEASKKIKITYQRYDTVMFDIFITNLGKNMYLYDEVNEKDIYGTGEIINLHNYIGGKVYTFEVFSKTGDCSDIELYSILLKLPKYNSYADTDFCIENPGFKYCDPWYKGYISTDDFSKAADEYNRELLKKQEADLKKSVVDGLYDFYQDYKLYIIGSMALVLTILGGMIIYKVRSRRTIKI